MKIQQTNLALANPNFGAKLSQTTLKTLGREVEYSAKGNMAIKNALEKLKSVGNKDTVIHIGDYYKGVEMVTIYHDEPDFEQEYTSRKIKITNPLMPGVEHTFDLRGASKSLLESIVDIASYGSRLSSEESALFKNYLNITDENPMVIFENISPFLKGNKNTFNELFNTAKSASNTYLNKISDKINARKEELNALNALLSENKSKCEEVIQNTEKELNSNDLITERETIFSAYC